VQEIGHLADGLVGVKRRATFVERIDDEQVALDVPDPRGEAVASAAAGISGTRRN